MWFRIVISYLVLLMLPTFLRKPVTGSFIQAALKPLDLLYYEWSQFRQDNLYKIEHTGQKCYLRGALNDRFDMVQRRIRIGKGQLNETEYIFTEAEQQTVFLDNDIWLFTESETADTGLNFLVYVPAEIYNTQIHGLRALIDFYKVAGKRYDILIDE